MIKHSKNTVFNLDRHRKYIRNIKRIQFYKNKLFLICHLNYLGGFSLRLLKEYFCSKSFEIYNYRDNFDFLLTSVRSQNYLYSYKSQKTLNKNILLMFDNFREIFLFSYRIKTLTLSPYNLYPLYFYSNNCNIILPFNYWSSYVCNYEYKYSDNDFFYYIYINIIKKIIITIFIFIITHITTPI